MTLALLGSQEAHFNVVPAMAVAAACVLLGLEIYAVVILHQKFEPDRFMSGYGVLLGAAGIGAGGQRFLSSWRPAGAPSPPSQ